MTLKGLAQWNGMTGGVSTFVWSLFCERTSEKQAKSPHDNVNIRVFVRIWNKGIKMGRPL